MRKRGKGSGKQELYGLSSRFFPKTVAPYVDYDYVEKLSPEEREWLAKFSDEFYGGSFTAPKPVHKTQALRRDCYRRKNWANKDAYGVSAATLGLDTLTPAGEEDNRLETRDLSPPPKYLATDEYREALAEYRAHLPQDDKTKVRDTPALQKAKSKLNRTKKTLL